MEQFSNRTFWGRHPMPYFKIPRTTSADRTIAMKEVKVFGEVVASCPRQPPFDLSPKAFDYIGIDGRITWVTVVQIVVHPMHCNDVGNRIHSVVYMPSSRPYTERTLAQRWQESSE